jgi:DNA-directed RNA polymerase I, II, and III subunit RPABC2
MSNSKSKTQNTEVKDIIDHTNKNDLATLDKTDDSLDKAIEVYKKIYEKEEMTEKEQKEIEEVCKTIKNRLILTQSADHKPIEIKNTTDTVVTGPPTLTRFEKARIMGSRALQLSLGAPPFIDFSKNISSSLEIAMEELQQRVIPIVIRRTLPNNDYQNIPIEQFE